MYTLAKMKGGGQKSIKHQTKQWEELHKNLNVEKSRWQKKKKIQEFLFGAASF